MPNFLSSLAYRIRKRWVKSVDWFRGWFLAHIVLEFYVLLHLPLPDISIFQRRIAFIERREYSQNGEDGIIHAIFRKIGRTNAFCVEFGVEDGRECNSRYLLQKNGWRGLLMDGQEWPTETGVRRAFITAENIEALFAQYDVPQHFDLLSIDIDGNDYWVWKAITRYRPRVVIIEYNAMMGPDRSVTIPYDSSFTWDKTDYYGASLRALDTLGRAKGYTLVGTDRNGVNAFFVLQELVHGNFTLPPWEKIFHAAAYKGIAGQRHPIDPLGRPWVGIPTMSVDAKNL